jgi:hypothetical protein
MEKPSTYFAALLAALDDANTRRFLIFWTCAPFRIKASCSTRLLTVSQFLIGAFNMLIPTFCAGQRVAVVHARPPFAPGGTYKIIRAQPAEGGPIRYCIKSDSEAFERIVDEARLEAVNYG